jgi:hypothetical protein
MFAGFSNRIAHHTSPSDFPRNYTDARERFERSARRPRTSSGPQEARVKLAHNTFLVRDDSDPLGTTRYAIVFHDTPIVRFNPSGWIVLDTGGWQTLTTRDRMRRAGVAIYCRSGVVHVSLPGGRSVAYRDGMAIRGAQHTGAGPDAFIVERARRANLRRNPEHPRLGTRQFSEWIKGGNVPEAFTD